MVMHGGAWAGSYRLELGGKQVRNSRPRDLMSTYLLPYLFVDGVYLRFCASAGAMPLASRCAVQATRLSSVRTGARVLARSWACGQDQKDCFWRLCHRLGVLSRVTVQSDDNQGRGLYMAADVLCADDCRSYAENTAVILSVPAHLCISAEIPTCWPLCWCVHQQVGTSSCRLPHPL